MSDTKIHKTKDYKKFRLITGNRPLNKSNMVKITKSIAERNMLHVAPIIINKDFEIVDGQHRFQIAKENGYPVYYVILEKGDLRSVHLLNNISRKWNTEDYIKSYAMQGLSDYKRFLKFMQDTGLAAQPASYMSMGIGGGQVFSQIKAGNLKFSEDDEAMGHLRNKYYEKLRKYFRGSLMRQEYLIRALIKVIDEGHIQQLLEFLEKRGIQIEHQGSVVAYLRDFESILNYKKKEAKNLTRLF